MLYSIPTQEVQLYSLVDFVRIRFKVLFAALEYREISTHCVLAQVCHHGGGLV